MKIFLFFGKGFAYTPTVPVYYTGTEGDCNDGKRIFSTDVQICSPPCPLPLIAFEILNLEEHCKYKCLQKIFRFHELLSETTSFVQQQVQAWEINGIQIFLIFGVFILPRESQKEIYGVLIFWGKKGVFFWWLPPPWPGTDSASIRCEAEKLINHGAVHSCLVFTDAQTNN